MENRHRDALLRIHEADRLWATDGHEPESFSLVHAGGLRREILHPAWDDSWAAPSEQTIDDLGELGFLRVAPSTNKTRLFDLTMSGRQQAEELELERHGPASATAASDGRAVAVEGWRHEVDAAVEWFLSQIGTESFSADDLAGAVGMRKFDSRAAFLELQRLESDGSVKRGGLGWYAASGSGAPFFHVRVAPVDAKDLMSGPIYAFDLTEDQVIANFVEPIQAGLPIKFGDRELVRYRTPAVARSNRSGAKAIDTLNRRYQQSKLAHAQNEAEESFFAEVGQDVTDTYFATPTAERVTGNAIHVGRDAERQLFVVHGHNRKDEVVLFLERVTGRKPVVLSDEAGRSRTIIEKFEETAAQASYAVVLLTADDLGRSSRAQENEMRPRARQNVILELGFFLGRIGRKNTIGLLGSGVEKPSDWEGVEYIDFDGEWKLKLGKELIAAGFHIDLGKA